MTEQGRARAREADQAAGLAGQVVLMRRIVLFLCGVMLLLLVLSLFVALWKSYEGRVEVRQTNIAGCERGKLDRGVNAIGWRYAEMARYDTATNPGEDRRQRLIAYRVALAYQAIAGDLEKRAAINCKVVFPKPSFWPWEHQAKPHLPTPAVIPRPLPEPPKYLVMPRDLRGG